MVTHVGAGTHCSAEVQMCGEYKKVNSKAAPDKSLLTAMLGGINKIIHPFFLDYLANAYTTRFIK